ncbi:hypothetical protein D9615_000528 [Tricholomella constricta]|uniref:Tyr recombinase domain-containing protein n=1 Tax=Tricholomella constricta TaxID=117010 RepID=A0A8H5HR95_9AGAR|nr:hypothetical protein D9615_000528 [Tricholomella constricta]
MPATRDHRLIISRLSCEWTSRLFRAQRESRDWPTARHDQLNAAPWQIPVPLRDHMNSVLSRAWKPSTASGYSRSVLDFLSFCTELGVPPAACLPASEDLLCVFAASFCGSLAGSSIRSKCAALRSWHIQNGLPWMGSVRLAYTIKGCDNSRPASSFAGKRPPVTLDALSAILSGLDTSSALDACVAALATTAFWGQLRLGEILPDREGLTGADRLPSWAQLHSPNQNGSRLLHLPNSKTSGRAGEDVVITRQASADPIQYLLTHYERTGSKVNWPLAWYRSDSGDPVSLTKRKFLIRCNSILSGLGRQPISGHSFRIGGTTHFLLCGVPPDVVKAMGRWSSDSFLRYWRSLEIIAPLHAEMLQPVLGRPPTTCPPA